MAFPMPCYLIAYIKITDKPWVRDYAENVDNIVHKHGGKYLARSGSIETVEGEPLASTLVALLKFPNCAVINAFATDPAYRPYGDAGKAVSTSRFHVIDSTDLAGTIP
jgi:uncharacterized protein (DUF1330 family)